MACDMPTWICEWRKERKDLPASGREGAVGDWVWGGPALSSGMLDAKSVCFNT